MPAIKINLNRLMNLFAKSVNSDELPEPIREFAARLMTLTAHVARVDQKIDAQVKALGDQVSTLTDIMHELAQSKGVATTAPETAAAPARVTQEADQVAATADQEEPTADDEFEARMRAEVEAEIAAVNTVAPVETVVVTRKQVGGIQ